MNAVTARRSALQTRTAARLDRLANKVSNDWTVTMEIGRKAAPLRLVVLAMDLAFAGWSVREIEEEIGRGLTDAEVRAVAEEHAAAAAFRREIAEAAAKEAELVARERAEETAWLAAMAA